MFALPQGGKPRRFDRRVLAAVLLVAGGPILGTPPALHVQSPSRSAGASDLSDPFSSVLCSLSAGEEPLPNYCKDSVKMHPDQLGLFSRILIPCIISTSSASLAVNLRQTSVPSAISHFAVRRRGLVLHIGSHNNVFT